MMNPMNQHKNIYILTTKQLYYTILCISTYNYFFIGLFITMVLQTISSISVKGVKKGEILSDYNRTFFYLDHSVVSK